MYGERVIDFARGVARGDGGVDRWSVRDFCPGEFVLSFFCGERSVCRGWGDGCKPVFFGVLLVSLTSCWGSFCFYPVWKFENRSMFRQ